MMPQNLSTPKLLGGIGAILFILSPVFAVIPYLGFLAGLAGPILIFISLYMFSKIFNDSRIFKNALIAFILEIIKDFVIFLTVGATIFSLFSLIGSDGRSLPFMFSNFGIKVIFVFIIIYAFYILSAYYFKSSFYLLSTYTGNKLFKAGGFCYFIGTILTIVMIGILINLVGWIIITVAFFTTPGEIKSET